MEILRNELNNTNDIDHTYIKIYDFYKISNLDFNNDEIIKNTNEIRKIFLQKQKYDYAKNIYNFILEFKNNNIIFEEATVKINEINTDDLKFSPFFDNYNLATSLFSQRKFDEAKIIYKEILENLGIDFYPFYPQRLKIMYNLGLIFYYEKMYPASLILLLFIHKYINIIFNNNKVEIDDSEFLLDGIFHEMGKVFIEEKNYEDALITFNLVFYYCNKKNNKNDKHKLDVMFNISNLYYKLGKFAKAELNYLSMDKIMQNSKYYGLNHPDTIANMYNIAIIFSEQGKFTDALTKMEQVYKIRKKTQGNTNINTIKIIYKLGCIYHKLKNYDVAIQKLNLAFKYLKDKKNLHLELTIDIKHYLGNIYFEQRIFDKALNEYNFIINDCKTFLESTNTPMLYLFDKIALTYYNLEKYQLAKLAWCKCIDTLTPNFNNQVVINDIYYHIGLTFYNLNEFNEAETIFKDAYIYWCNRFSPSHYRSELIKKLLLSIYTKKYVIYIKKNKKLIDKIDAANIKCKNKLVTISVAYKMGVIYYYKNKLEIALEIFTDLLNYQKDNSEFNIIENINTLYNLACINYKMDNFQKTEEIINEILLLQKTNLKYPIESIIFTLQNLSLIYYKQNKIDDALVVCEEILKLQEKSLGINHQDTIFTIKLIEEIL